MVLLVICIFILLLSLPVLAKEIQVNAFVSESRVEVGQSLTLTVQIQGDLNSPAPDIQIPDFKVQYYGPSTQVSIVNGKKTESVSHLYSLIPLKTGKLEIPPIEVKVRGKKYYTQPIQIIVEERGQGKNRTLEEKLKDLIFLEVELDRKRVYINEEIPLTIKLFFHRDIELTNIHYPELDLKNFLLKPFREPVKSMEIRNGQYYYVYPFKTTIQPISKGEYKIGPVILKADVVIPRRSRSTSFFDSFFSTDYDLYPLNLLSEEITLKVLDFPLEGRPANFKGAIGRFNMEVTITPDQVKLGEPVTIRTRITGKGNFNTVTAPELEKNSQFKYYDPQTVSTKSGESGIGEKVFEQVVIPKSKVKALPVISFSYFDPEEEKYHTIEHGPIPIQVIGTGEKTSQVMDYSKKEGKEQVVGQDILYIKSNTGRFMPVGQTILTSYYFWGYNLAVLIVLIVGVILYWKLNRETLAERKRKEAKARIQKLLKEGEKLLKKGEKDEFYNTIYQAVQNYFKEYFQIAITGISDYETDRLLKAGLSLELIEEIKEFYREIDEKRFAGSFSTEADMERMLKKARTIISQIEKGEVA